MKRVKADGRTFWTTNFLTVKSWLTVSSVIFTVMSP